MAEPEISQHESSKSPMIDDSLQLTIIYRGKPYPMPVDEEMTISQLAAELCDIFGADVQKSKLWFRPRPGMQSYPYSDTLLQEILRPDTRIQLIATTTNELKEIDAAAAMSRGQRARAGTKSTTKAYKSRDWKTIQEESTYTFHTIQPLPYLPNPERSKRFLERLANDPGIKASMRKHKFSVGLLTEMNPAEHTTQESRTLGLNRNRGEVIELRLRTDRYDGYRDYKVIRKTLCHELSHNVWGEHDRNFWDLTKQIEDEVERGDWKHGGHRLTEDEFYNPNDKLEDVEHLDNGAWTGGEFILGSLPGSDGQAGLSRREIIARAAQSRLEKERSQKNKQ